MAKQDSEKRYKSELKNAKAKIKRRDEKIKRLTAKNAALMRESKKKEPAGNTALARQKIMESFQGINTRISQSGSPLRSDQLQASVLEQLLKSLGV